MRSTSALIAAFVLGAASLPASANDVFRNGQSFWGQPADQGSIATARVVDLGTARHLRVAYGETVKFRSEGKEFFWTFNGLDRKAVDLDRFAPAGFSSQPLTVHVAQNPTFRR